MTFLSPCQTFLCSVDSSSDSNQALFMTALKASLNILLAWHFEMFQTSLGTSDLTHTMYLLSLPFHILKVNKNADASFCVHLLYLIKNKKQMVC